MRAQARSRQAMLLVSVLASFILPVGVLGGGASPLLASAGAYANPSPTSYSTSGSLPDARVYEQVSPVRKNGNYVASGGITATEHAGYAVAAADGNALLFLGSGAMGDASSSVLGPYVSHRAAAAWGTSSATPPQLGVVSTFGSPTTLVPGSDFMRFAFGVFNGATRYSPEQPAGPSASVNLYTSSNPFLSPAWLGKPAMEDPLPVPGENGRNDFLVAGVAPTMRSVYFEYSGTLTAQDEARAANVGGGTGEREAAPWGFYEWRDGVLGSAGVLPGGTTSPFGAVPAALAGDLHHSPWQAANFDNEVSADGSRAFFVSPDPAASTVTDQVPCEEEGPCTAEPPQLYVRETAPNGSKRTILLSQSQIPGHLGEPAPNGAASVLDADIQEGGNEGDRTYVYGSADGTHAFFTSKDALTQLAPNDSSLKEYDFNLQTGVLTWLPGVGGPIVAAARDGSDFLFKSTATSPAELDLWRAGAGGGSITPVTQLPQPIEPPSEERRYFGILGIEARASASGADFVFDTNSPLPGGFTNQLGFAEVYRYDVSSNTLACVSCAPAGVTPSGNAFVSYDNRGGSNDKPRSTIDTRVISSDGSRVFFDTPDQLVPWDSNGKRDVYEWENGTVHLLSSGKSSEDTFYLDNSESGDDAFFNTTEGLVRSDRDGAYDAYDARVPRPGDQPPPAPAPCQPGNCQSPPEAPPGLATPASESFDGMGNLPPQPPASKPPPKPLTRAQKLEKAMVACRHKPKGARHRCQAQARRRYGAHRRAARSRK